MRITVKREQIKRVALNKWVILSIAVFAFTVAAGYLVATSINTATETQQISTLNVECGLYGQQLTSELSANSSACLENTNFTSESNLTTICGAVFYCTYSSSCALAKPVETNSLSCLCTALKPTEVIASGLCFKQSLD